MEDSVQANYLESVRQLFRYYKSLGDKAMEQVSDAALFHLPEAESNNIAIIVGHLHGNMLSRWTDFLSSDGEKPWRQRDREFENNFQSREEVLTAWEEGWKCFFDAIEPLTAGQLQQIIYIRNEGHTVLEAINRQLGHYAYHVGQIVFLARLHCSANWQSLSVPKGGSKAYNQQKFKEDKGRRHFV